MLYESFSFNYSWLFATMKLLSFFYLQNFIIKLIFCRQTNFGRSSRARRSACSWSTTRRRWPTRDYCLIPTSWRRGTSSWRWLLRGSPTRGVLRWAESTIVSEGFKGGTPGSPIMPRDVSLSDSKCWEGRSSWRWSWHGSPTRGELRWGKERRGK